MKLKTILSFILPLASVAAVVPIIATSCSTATTSRNVQKVEFSSKVSASRTLKSSDSSESSNTTGETLILDPNINPSAIEKANQTFKTLDKDELQTDFNNVLTKFFRTYEYEEEFENSSTEVEIESELKKVEVKEYNQETLTAKLNVTYLVEKETETNDTESKEKVLETQEKSLTLKPSFATKTEIASIQKMLEDADKKDSDNNSAFSTDIDDLLELYVGDKDDNEKSIFEQVNSFTTENNLGGLLGYEIKLSDLAYTPNSQNIKTTSSTTNNNEISIFAPSSVITEFYVPDFVWNDIDLTFDYSKLAQKTISDVKSINDKNALNDILMVSIPESVNVSSVEVKEIATTTTPPPSIEGSDTTQKSSEGSSGDSVSTSSTVEELEVIVKFKDETTTTPETSTTVEENQESTPPTIDVKLVIKTSWLKQATTNSGSKK